MKRKYIIILMCGLSGLMYGCKKSSSSNDVAISLSYEAGGTNFAFSGTANQTLLYNLPSYRTFALSDSLGYLGGTTIPVSVSGEPLSNSIGFVFHIPGTQRGAVMPGTYTYHMETPLSFADSAYVITAATLIYTVSNVSIYYRRLLSDTIHITSVSGSYVSGTFEATFANGLNGDSLMHVSNGRFSNLYALGNGQNNPYLIPL